jgi:hypothetical protein
LPQKQVEVSPSRGWRIVLVFVVSTYISAPILRRGRVSGGPSFVAVMQPTDLGQRHDSPHVLRPNPSRLGRVLPQREMRSRSVIVIQVGSEDAMERAFMEHDHMVQAFPSNRTNHPLDVGSLPGRARRGQHLANAHVSHLFSEVSAEDGVRSRSR